MNHEEWINSVKPKLHPDASHHVLAAITSAPENIRTLYKVKTEMHTALQSLLKVCSSHFQCDLSFPNICILCFTFLLLVSKS